MIAAVHPKVIPMILYAEDEGRWLTATMDEVLALVAPFPSQLMTVA